MKAPQVPDSAGEPLSRLERTVTRLTRLRPSRQGTVWVTAAHERRLVVRERDLFLRVAELERDVAVAREATVRAQAGVLAARAERLAWHGAGLLDEALVDGVFEAVAAVTADVDEFLAEIFPTTHQS